MCKYCGKLFGHKPGCPDYEEPESEIIGECELCGRNIEEGQDYFDQNGDLYHYDCFVDEYFHNG